MFSNSSTNKDTEVISKYFAHTANNQVMDDSSDFQEPKKSIKGPKQGQTTKPRVKKNVKKTKGQKDIRQVLKNNKNDLVAYSKDFDKVCKKSGIDIDSEQLQLAIALSRSLHNSNEDKKIDPQSSESSGSQISQDRTNKIRTTLLEYGFKVPEIKINNNKRKRKWSRSNSRLLLISEVERQKIIHNKFTHIISNHVVTDLNTNNTAINANSAWFNLASSKSYNELIDEDIFYVNELNIERSCPVGRLLKDWAEIPGRPASPVIVKPIDFKISGISLKADEVDTLLSGLLDSAQSIIRSVISNSCGLSELTSDKMESNGDETIEARCLSPDLFDESELEHSVIIPSKLVTDSTEIVNMSSPKEISRRKSYDYMDLTDCVHQSRSKASMSYSQPTISSKKTDTRNLTRRNSYDLMEITECIQIGSGKLIEGQQIDLTQSSDSRDGTVIVYDNKAGKLEDELGVDLTQSSYSDDSLPAIHISGKAKPESYSIDNVVEIQETVHSHQVIDDNVKDVDIPTINKRTSFEDFNFNHSDEDGVKAISDCDIVHIADNVDVKCNDSSVLSIHKSITEDVKLNCLGKNDDISIDYDDVCNDVANEDNTIEQEVVMDEKSDKISSSCNESNDIEAAATKSDVFEISDEEFNYSVHKSVLAKTDDLQVQSNNKNNFDVGRVSNIMEDLSAIESRSNENSFADTSMLPIVEIRGNTVKIKSPIKTTDKTPKRMTIHELELVKTPNNSEYLMKTDKVTPIQDYTSLNTPDMNRELDKYGLKPFKRKRAIQLLTHLYNQTHPVLENSDSPPKKKKIYPEPRNILSITTEPQSEGSCTSKEVRVNPWDVCAIVGDIPCDPTDWVFQKREKAKVSSCRLPLHIAFHNHVSSSRDLRTAILHYEPVDIDVVHRTLVAHGHRYDPKDLLKFMDKRCVTVKTAESARNKRNEKK